MPSLGIAVPMTMDEGDGGREIGVMVNQIGKIGHCLSAFVFGNVDIGAVVVHVVNSVLPAFT